MKSYALDTNCFIDAFNRSSPAFDAMQWILRAAKAEFVSLRVSLQTLHELEAKNDQAWELARSLLELPHYPIGNWLDQVGTWSHLAGTWDDAARNDTIQLKLQGLANSGTDIRDRGGYIDALCNQIDGFVTSDKQLIATGPSRRINERFATKVLTPKQVVEVLSNDNPLQGRQAPTG
jgi:hypothetical protein